MASAVFAQANAAVDIETARDGAVAAIQRARALATPPADGAIEATGAARDASPAAATPVEAASWAGGEVVDRAAVSTVARPLGAPSSTAGSSALDQMSSVDGGSNGVLNTLSALGVVIGLVFVARWVLVRMKGGTPTARASASASSAVEVLTRVPIGNRQRVLLLRVGGRIVVVGDSGGTLSTLAEVADEEEVAGLLSAVSGESAHGVSNGFRDVYRKLSGGDEGAAEMPQADRPVAAVAEEAPGEAHTEVRQLLSRVRSTAAGLAGGRA
ncbi:MAG: flagellar biosynthetic protein FliO [Planctomycetota bacterium]